MTRACERVAAREITRKRERERERGRERGTVRIWRDERMLKRNGMIEYTYIYIYKIITQLQIYIYSHIYVLYIYLCVYIYILEEASYLTEEKKSMIDILYTESIHNIYTYTYTFKRVPMCARAYVRVRARTRGHCISSTHPLANHPPPATPFPPPSPPPSPCEQPAISCREPTRYTHLRTYPLRITVAMLCRDVLNE